MAAKPGYGSHADEKPPIQDGKAAIRSTPDQGRQAVKGKPKDYTSEGVTDNDIFLLPGSDFQLLGLLTFLAAAVRLFRIYQPSSVVFDEVQ